MTRLPQKDLDKALWSWFPELDGKASIPRSRQCRLAKRDRVYFIFVEDVSKLSTRSIDAPDGATMVPDHVVFDGSVWRFRNSAMLVTDVVPELPRFEPLLAGSITADQRETRRGQLNDLFGRVPVPVLDIFVTEYDPELAALRATLLPGSWYSLTCRMGADRKSARPVYIGAPELGEPGSFERGGLRFIASVSPPLEIKLRDVFSLAHVPDATMRGPESASAEVPPDLPPDDPDKAGLARKIMEYPYATPAAGHEGVRAATAQSQSS